MIWISCFALHEAGLLPPGTGCCGSCHSDNDDGMEMHGVYADNVGIENDRTYKLYGDICCGTAIALDNRGDRRETLRKLYDLQVAASSELLPTQLDADLPNPPSQE